MIGTSADLQFLAAEGDKNICLEMRTNDLMNYNIVQWNQTQGFHWGYDTTTIFPRKDSYKAIVDVLQVH